MTCLPGLALEWARLRRRTLRDLGTEASRVPVTRVHIETLPGLM